MNKFFNIDLGPSLISYYDQTLSKGLIIKDKNCNRTTLVLYIAVYEDSMIDFIEIETLAQFKNVGSTNDDEKILRKYFKDPPPEGLGGDEVLVETFKKNVHDMNGKDWRKLKYSSNFIFNGKKIEKSPAHTIHFKFQLPNCDHVLPQFP